jgi:hypothetical protein
MLIIFHNLFVSCDIEMKHRKGRARSVCFPPQSGSELICRFYIPLSLTDRGRKKIVKLFFDIFADISVSIPISYSSFLIPKTNFVYVLLLVCVLIIFQNDNHSWVKDFNLLSFYYKIKTT